MTRGENLHYCYRCYHCGALITKLQILDAWEAKEATLCACGSRKINPGNAKWWEELFLPRCWRLIWAIWTNKVSPAPKPLSDEDQEARDQFGMQEARNLDKRMSELARGKVAL